MKYKVQKILNNNSILVEDERGSSMILMAKGIGFGKKSGYTFEDIDTQVHIYRFSKMTERGKAMDIIRDVDPVFIEIAAKIIENAELAFHNVDKNILLPLSDHIAFAIERMKANMDISNPFAKEIALLYKDEYDIAVQGRDIIERMTGYVINDAEVGYITLHVHSARGESTMSDAMHAAIIIRESIEKVERDYDIKISTDSMSYIRLMNHMKFLMLRMQTEEELQIDVGSFVSKQFPYAYTTAKKICDDLHRAFLRDIPNVEVGYLALHIERVRTYELKKKEDERIAQCACG